MCFVMAVIASDLLISGVLGFVPGDALPYWTTSRATDCSVRTETGLREARRPMVRAA